MALARRRRSHVTSNRVSDAAIRILKIREQRLADKKIGGCAGKSRKIRVRDFLTSRELSGMSYVFLQAGHSPLRLDRLAGAGPATFHKILGIIQLVRVVLKIDVPAKIPTFLIACGSPSHGENRGSSPLGSANKVKHLFQTDRLVSNDCPINVYGQAWTACRFFRLGKSAMLSWMPLKSWHPGGLSPKSVCKTIRRSPASKFQCSTSSALFLQPKELALDPRRVRSFRKEPLAASIPKRRAFDGPNGGTALCV